jgi:hypothetical protein
MTTATSNPYALVEVGALRQQLAVAERRIAGLVAEVQGLQHLLAERRGVEAAPEIVPVEPAPSTARTCRLCGRPLPVDWPRFSYYCSRRCSTAFAHARELVRERGGRTVQRRKAKGAA